MSIFLPIFNQIHSNEPCLSPWSLFSWSRSFQLFWKPKDDHVYCSKSEVEIFSVFMADLE
jgi:hypothetical protein